MTVVDHSACEKKERALRSALKERIATCDELQDFLDAANDEILRLRDRIDGGW